MLPAAALLGVVTAAAASAVSETAVENVYSGVAGSIDGFASFVDLAAVSDAHFEAYLNLIEGH